MTPLGLIAIRLAAYLPLGDLGFRGNFASCLLLSLAVAWMGRLCVDFLVLLRPSREARQGWRDFLYEPIAATGAALTVAFSLASYESATTVGQSAFTLMLVVAAWQCVASLIRGQKKVSKGLCLAALAGGSSCVHPIAAVLLWPVLLVIGVWSLRQGERWPLLSPGVFLLAFGGTALATFAASPIPISGRELMAGFSYPIGFGIQHLPAAILRLTDALGVIGCLLACIGILIFLPRFLLLGVWLLFTLVTALVCSEPLPVLATEPPRFALTLALFICAPMVACGIFQVASKLGRARAAAALTLSVMAFVVPAMEGGRDRWVQRSMLPLPLLERGLAKAAPRSAIFPGSLPMSGLFRLGQVWGLRPDLLYIPSSALTQDAPSFKYNVGKPEE
jgi:hypothetical protein